MVIVKCEKCGKEYELGYGEKLSDFQCECGGELSPNEIESTPLITPKTQIKPNIEDNLDKKRENKKIGLIGVFIFGLILIIVVTATMFSNNTNSGNSNITNSNTVIPNITYHANGLTFEYPADWKQLSNLNST